MNEKQSLHFFPIEYVYLPLRGERSRELNRLSYWLSLPKVALHLHKVEGFWTLLHRWTHPIRSPTVAIAHVAGNRQLSIEMNGIVSLCRWVSLVVWTGLQSFYRIYFSPFRCTKLFFRCVFCFNLEWCLRLTTRCVQFSAYLHKPTD